MLDEIRNEIEKVIEGYSDGTYQGLSHGHLIEYFSDGYKNPQTLADEIMMVIKRHLTHAAPDAGQVEVTSGQVAPPAQVS